MPVTRYSNHGPCIAGTEYRAESGGDDVEVKTEDKFGILKILLVDLSGIRTS
jgi:hypothetical protein